MSRTLKVRFRGTVDSLAKASALLDRTGDAALVARGRPRLLVITCPCGCGEHLPVNLDERVGPAWRYYVNDKNGMSLFPSVWRTSGCRSHFIIWKGQMWLFSYGADALDDDSTLSDLPTAEAVLQLLPSVGFAHFSAVAEQLNVVPWDVLTVCRFLAREGLACEGSGKKTGKFRRR